MATSVQVLCPNGRRQNVKVTPNTKVMQVLEEVCTKQSFLPPDDYDLIHGRKTLDLTLAFRFSNLPNNAKLELVKAATSRSQAQGEVIIALQLESGERLQHAFSPSTSLWEILEHWESQDTSRKGKLTYVDSSQTPPLHPVCIYMRDEIIGEHALKYTTLRKLALTSGKAIIRLVHRGVDDITLAGIVDKIEQEKAKQARLAAKAQRSDTSCSQHSSSVDVTANNSGTEAVKTDKTNTEEKMDVDEAKKEPEKKPAHKVDAEKTAVPQTEAMDTDDTKDQASTSRELREGGSSSVNGGKPAEGGATGSSAIEQLRRMNIPGVEIITPSDFYDLTPEQQQVARLLAQRLIPGAMGSQQQASPKPKKPKTAPAQHPFAEFKFPEESKGKDLYRNEFSEVKHEEYRPCEREAVIYDSNEGNASKAVSEDLPDEFFEVTDVDVKSLYKDLQKHASDERPLMTEAMRQAELEQRHQQYDHILIRIQFPDGLVLQGCFRPRETVYALHKFVKEHLEDKGQDFYLYRTPPKQILSDMLKTLVQADLAPATLLYFGSDKKEDHSLVASARQEIAPKRRADELSVKKLARKQMEDLAAEGTSSMSAVADTYPTSGSQVRGQGESAPAPSRRPGSASVPKTSGAPTSGDAKVPKWLKIGKK